MKVIYSCYWGSYLAVVAASLHLRFIIGQEDLTDEKLYRLPYFGNIKREDLGEMFYIGTDNRGREVFIMGSKKAGRVIERSLNGFAQIYGIEKNQIDFVDLTKFNNLYLTFGAFLIHRLGLRQLGLRFIGYGIKKDFDRLRKIVSKVLNEPPYSGGESP